MVSADLWPVPVQRRIGIAAHPQDAFLVVADVAAVLVPEQNLVAGHAQPGRAELLDVIGNGGRRHIVIGQAHGDAGSGDHFGYDASHVFGEETRVIADDDADGASVGFMLEDVAGYCSGNTAHVGEGEVVGDKTAPAVGSEFDLGHSWLLVAHRCSFATRRFFRC